MKKLGEREQVVAEDGKCYNRGNSVKVILWDVDGTLLNFEKSENFAIKKCFSIFHLGECTDEMIARYSAINRFIGNSWKIGDSLTSDKAIK